MSKAKATYSQKFRKEWLKVPAFTKWLCEVPTDSSKAHCKFCRCDILAKFSLLTSHCETKKHKLSTIKQESPGTGSVLQEKSIDETGDNFSHPNGISLQCSEANIDQIDEPKKEKIRKRIRTPDGNFIIIESERVLFDRKESSADEIKKFASDVVDIFKVDLENFLRKNDCVMRSVQRNPDFIAGKNGMARITRMLVGQVAQQYLMDYTMDSWRSGTTPGTNDLMASKLGALEEIMEKSVTDVRNIKQQLETQDDFGQSEILLANMDIGL